MQKKLAAYLILALLCAASLTARQAAPAWVTYTPPSKKFTVQFPVAPEADHRALGTGLFTALDEYISAQHGNVFSINYMAINPKADLSADAVMESARDGLLQVGGAKQLTSAKSQFTRAPNDQLPMLEFTGETDTTAVMGRIIFVTDHIYTLSALCSKKQDSSADAAKFFTSFKLRPRTASQQ